MKGQDRLTVPCRSRPSRLTWASPRRSSPATRLAAARGRGAPRRAGRAPPGGAVAPAHRRPRAGRARWDGTGRAAEPLPLGHSGLGSGRAGRSPWQAQPCSVAGRCSRCGKPFSRRASWVGGGGAARRGWGAVRGRSAGGGRGWAVAAGAGRPPLPRRGALRQGSAGVSTGSGRPP